MAASRTPLWFRSGWDVRIGVGPEGEESEALAGATRWRAEIWSRLSSSLVLGGFSHDSGSGLAEVLAGRCLFRNLCWTAFHFAFQFISLPLCFIGFCTLLCHVHHIWMVEDRVTTLTRSSRPSQEERILAACSGDVVLLPRASEGPHSVQRVLQSISFVNVVSGYMEKFSCTGYDRLFRVGQACSENLFVPFEDGSPVQNFPVLMNRKLKT